MRSTLALLATTTPALAHPGAGLHSHDATPLTVAALAFSVALGLTLRATLRPAPVTNRKAKP